MTGITCWYCGEGVDTRRSGTMREVVGWEELRRGGGANKITGRVTTGKWAHRACVQHDTGKRQASLI